ncbi:aminopeptidase P family N-terminal domain-containing protein [Desulfosporosinus nitroreducens]|uniref:Aminopeptidase P family N-terminal domain-containing protein n=1 Tax=Desulfosporosinus nitroreducens TaxID=2018668 RepID=A0ABT8QQR7_9FIRM|nr:aminopeptidase P family N-terminal domain-containing protein [Desulfosporosinus nitroreducens]MDO0823692.1 aminopeptidase P family N-terminal domain-containing protein [Desulfosporosinus nitroreducens]
MRIPIKELQERISNLQVNLQKRGIEGALLVQRADTLYFSGTAQNVHVYIPVEGKPMVLAYRDFARAKSESSWRLYRLKACRKFQRISRKRGFPCLEYSA